MKIDLKLFRERDLVYNASTDFEAHENNIHRLMSRAIGQPFIDYSITPYWSDMCFKEGLAVLLGTYIYKKSIKVVFKL